MPSSPLALRLAVPEDADALERLCALDSAPFLRGPAVVAHRGAQLLAAVSIADGRAVADPFESTAGAVEILRLRARQLAAELPVRGERPLRLRMPIVQTR
jgi:hypothetical protein